MNMIETNRLTLRPWTMNDTDELVEAINDIEVTRWLTVVPFPYTKKDAKDYISKCISGAVGEKFAFAIEHKKDRKVIGGTGIGFEKDGAAGGGIWLGTKYHGKGFGTEVYSARAKFCFDVLKVPYIVSGYFEGNEPSRKLHEKIGFKKTGEPDIRDCRATGEKVACYKCILTRQDYLSSENKIQKKEEKWH